MKLIRQCNKGIWNIYRLMSVILPLTGNIAATNYSSMGISDVVNIADRSLQQGNFRDAIPAFREIINRTATLTDPQSREIVQTCRFQLARAHYQLDNVPAGIEVLSQYLNNEPRKKERMVLRMIAQWFFDIEAWEKTEEAANRLLQFPFVKKEDRYNANLLLGQAKFRLEKWKETVSHLNYAVQNSKEPHVRDICRIMIVRSLVEAENWNELYSWIRRIYQTDLKYNINLNLTLMKAGKARFEDEDFLNALLLYRMVLPRETLLSFSDVHARTLEEKLRRDVRRGIAKKETKERQNEITEIRESMEAIGELPAYEDEVTFRIGKIYAELKRYWEGYVLFDKLYRKGRNSEIGEAAMLQSVLVLYDVEAAERAEERILRYLDKHPDGQYVRTLLSMVYRDNLVKQKLNRLDELKTYLSKISSLKDEDERELQADIHYMQAFGYLQQQEYSSAGEEFSVIMDSYPESRRYSASSYYRGMTFLFQGDYANALADFKMYQTESASGEHISAALFREAVCQFGLENISETEKILSGFIEKFPDDLLVSEAYSMRGDIEASKEASTEDPHTLDRALADYRQGIDKATIPSQASYAAFQAGKVCKLESRWQEIIDLMNYYLERWGNQSNVAEAAFWIGQARIGLEQIDGVIPAYLDVIERYGDDPMQQGVDKIIFKLIEIADNRLSEEDREDLAGRLELKLAHLDESLQVFRLRLRVALSLLQDDDAAERLGTELLKNKVDLKITSPLSLSLMCDTAVDAGNTEAMQYLFEYFTENYEESDMLWHAYRARMHKLLAEEDFQGALKVIDKAQDIFGAEWFMGWAQISKANTRYRLGEYTQAEQDYNMIRSVPEWRGPLFAEAMYGMGKCRQARGDIEAAHSFFQRTYLLFKTYSDGDWAARGYLAAADVLIELERQEDAVNTLKAMLEDVYTNTNPLTVQARERLKKYGG